VDQVRGGYFTGTKERHQSGARFVGGKPIEDPVQDRADRDRDFDAADAVPSASRLNT